MWAALMAGRAGDDGGLPRNDRGTCNHRAKATRSVVYCGTTWRTCKRQRADREITVASESSGSRAWLPRCRRNDRPPPRARSGTAGENPALTWEAGRELPDLSCFDSANWGSRKCVLATRNRPMQQNSLIKWFCLVFT